MSSETLSPLSFLISEMGLRRLTLTVSFTHTGLVTGKDRPASQSVSQLAGITTVSPSVGNRPHIWA